MDCGRRSAVDDDRSCRMRLAVDDDRCQGRWAVDEACSRIAFYQAQSKESLDRVDKNLDLIRENLRAIRKMRMSSATIPRYSSSSLSSSAPRRRHQSLHSPTIVNDYPPLLLPLRWYDPPLEYPPLELPLRWRDPPPFQHPPSPNSFRPHWQSPSEPSHPSSLSPPVRFRIPEPDIQPDPTAATPPLPPAQTELPPPLPLCPRNLALGVKPDLTRSDSGSASALSLDRPADLPVLQATRPSPPMTLYAPVTDAFHHPTHLPHPDPTSSNDDGFAPQTPVQTHPTIADGILQSSAHQQSRDTIPFDPMPDSLIHLQRAPPEAVEQDGHGDHGHGDCDLETHEVTSATIFDSVEATSAQLIGYFINYKDWIPLEIENRRKIIRLDKACCGRTGEISSEIGKLENLDTILLQVNDLTRELPSELDQLQSLQSMDLPKNTFTGPVEIQLRKNTFTGSITQHLDTKGWLLFTSGPDDTKRLLNEGFLHLRRKVMHRSRFMRKSSILSSIVNRVKKDLIQNPLHIIFYVDVLSMTRSTLASLSKGFAELSTDRQFLQLRSKQVWSRWNTGFGYGFLQGTEAFAQGVAFGVTVVLTKPVENARQHGFLGLAHGIGRAFLGVVVQRLSGALDFVSLTVDGIGACCVKCLDIINNKAYSLQCSQDVRRNVNKGWDLKFELSDPAYRSKENGKLTFYGPTTTIEEQGIKELDMRPDGISSLLHFTDLKGRDKELVMQWLRKPSIEHSVAELYINIFTLSIRRHGPNGGMGNTTLLQQVYEDEMIKEFNLKKWVCAFSNFEEEEWDKTKWENVLASLSCGIWGRDWLCAENSYSSTNWQTKMLVHFKDSKVEPPHLDWGKPLHVVILKTAFKVFDPGICLLQLLCQ